MVHSSISKKKHLTRTTILRCHDAIPPIPACAAILHCLGIDPPAAISSLCNYNFQTNDYITIPSTKYAFIL